MKAFLISFRAAGPFRPTPVFGPSTLSLPGLGRHSKSSVAGCGGTRVAALSSPPSSCLSGQTAELTPVPFPGVEPQRLHRGLTRRLHFKGVSGQRTGQRPPPASFILRLLPLLCPLSPLTLLLLLALAPPSQQPPPCCPFMLWNESPARLPCQAKQGLISF